jgi:hypothetical protein
MRLPYVAFLSFFLIRELSGIRTLIAFHPYVGGAVRVSTVARL